jgi:cell division protein FtsI (penicillin-binding protein 3)
VSLTLIKRDSDPTTVKVYGPRTAALMRGMLEAAVVGPDGAKAAQVPGYRVAGKSGTARKIVNGQYSTQRYRSSFVGLAPVSDPRIVVAISIDEPTVGGYYGGAIAAPVFSRVTGDALRLMDVKPDAPYASAVAAAGGLEAPR